MSFPDNRVTFTTFVGRSLEDDEQGDHEERRDHQPQESSAHWSKPDWLLAAKETVLPSFHFKADYLLMLTALIGTTIAPWQFFYLQAGYVEKKVGPRQYKHARWDVLVGSISCMVIVFFIIVCCAAALNAKGLTSINDAGEAAKALVPLAGKWAAGLFAFGLLNASLFAASTGSTITETAWPSGIPGSASSSMERP